MTKQIATSKAWKLASGETPIYRMEPKYRAALLRAFVGQQVRLDVDTHRDGTAVQTYEGELISVAWPSMGTVSELVILRRDGYQDTAYSAARVRRLRPVFEES